eukprot:CAMPEP_0181048650 /NCGR_PEP_ID=MMETSP1070-20121207/15548_1 /TAXON_ID=265543 /ORGANISM="Minutocellus polymorphus, Strain NH13" /LENGTH=49 /DNA_ID=CAMNT_0023127447 /DNA_START=1 /DNA_END=153 /DNA_ORIENTATION=-
MGGAGPGPQPGGSLRGGSSLAGMRPRQVAGRDGAGRQRGPIGSPPDGSA